jgi:hypothetical protein
MQHVSHWQEFNYKPTFVPAPIFNILKAKVQILLHPGKDDVICFITR